MSAAFQVPLGRRSRAEPPGSFGALPQTGQRGESPVPPLPVPRQPSLSRPAAPVKVTSYFSFFIPAADGGTRAESTQRHFPINQRLQTLKLSQHPPASQSARGAISAGRTPARPGAEPDPSLLAPPGAGSPHLPAGRWAGSLLQPTWPPASSARPAAPGSSGTSHRPPPAPAAALRSRRRRTPLLRAAGGGRSAPPRGRRRRRRTGVFSEGRAPAPRSPPPPAERAKRASAPSIAESSAPLPPTSATRPAGGKINK